MAQPGDIIVGCGSVSNHQEGKAIFVSRISGKLSFDQYWSDERFLEKRPFFGGSLSRAYGDNIYHHDENGSWIQERSHHSFADGSLNAANLERDTGSDNVLWCSEFVYYGQSAIQIPQNLRNVQGDDLYPLIRDYRSNYLPEMIAAVEAWFATLPRNRQGLPEAWH